MAICSGFLIFKQIIKMVRLLLLILLLPVSLFAQQANVTKYTTQKAGTVVLRDVEDKYNAQIVNLEAPNPDGNADKIRLRKAKEKVSELYPRVNDRSQSKGSANLPVPTVEKSYLADTVSGIPPDNDMAISKKDISISVINSLISIIDGSNGQILYRKTLGYFAQNIGLSGLNDNKYDPKVQYDPEADRYIVIMLNGRDQYNYVVVGFSQSNDPTGAWAFYKFYGDYKSDTTWFDYPGVVITKDELFVTGNKIKFAAPWETGFTESVIYQINKKDGYSGATNLTYQIWDGIKYGGNSIRNLFPVRPGRGMEGPEQYFLSNRNFDVQNDSIFLVKVPDALSANNNSLTIEQLSSPLKYGVPPNGRQTDTFDLATNDGRILGAYAMNGEIQFVSTTVDPANGAAGIYHGRISNYDSAPKITHAHIYSVADLDFGYPNILYTGDSLGENYSIISFNYTGPNTHPGFGAIFNFENEYSDMVKIKEGDAHIVRLNGKNQRWGDYTGAQVDFNDTSAVWVSGIFGRANNLYGSWMAKLKSPYAPVYPDVLDTIQGTEAKFYPNPAVAMVNYDFYVPEDGTVRFNIYGMDGKLVDELLQQNVKKGRNAIQFNTANLFSGIYFIKGVNQTGEVILEQKFVKQ